MAKYPYMVKFNGKYYEAGEDVPEKEVAAKAASSSDKSERKPSKMPKEKDE